MRTAIAPFPSSTVRVVGLTRHLRLGWGGLQVQVEGARVRVAAERRVAARLWGGVEIGTGVAMHLVVEGAEGDQHTIRAVAGGVTHIAHGLVGRLGLTGCATAAAVLRSRACASWVPRGFIRTELPFVIKGKARGIAGSTPTATPTRSPTLVQLHGLCIQVWPAAVASAAVLGIQGGHWLLFLPLYYSSPTTCCPPWPARSRARWWQLERG